ncbi:hypothetical protein Tco_1549494 [Tanacetum coccineum]
MISEVRQCARLTSAYMVVVFDEVTFPQMKGLRLKVFEELPPSLVHHDIEALDNSGDEVRQCGIDPSRDQSLHFIGLTVIDSS